MQALLDLLSNPVFLKLVKLLLAYYVLAALVGAWEKPNEAEHPRWYCYLWRVANILAANVKRATIALKVPGADQQP